MCLEGLVSTPFLKIPWNHFFCCLQLMYVQSFSLLRMASWISLAGHLGPLPLIPVIKGSFSLVTESGVVLLVGYGQERIQNVDVSKMAISVMS